MRVVINAQLDPYHSGGIAQVLVGLAHGLTRLDGQEEYIFICSDQSAEWLRPHTAGHHEIIINKKRTPAPRLGPRESNGFFESFRPDVIHFPYQSYTRTDIPTLFNPHDLQHRHLPELFTPEERQRRDSLLRAGCTESDAVVVASEWVRQDVVRQYAVEPNKVHVVAWGAPTAAYDQPTASQIDAVLDRFQLTRGFVLYPAQTWPHKNHARLIDALALLRERDALNIPLVCTGARTEYARVLEQQVERLGLSAAVSFLGRVGEGELKALYRAARMVVVPTLFEAVSFPIYEAFAEGVAVACSHVTALPDQVGNAAILFDPYSIEDIAAAIRRVFVDTALRRLLIERGTARMAQLDWTRTARAYRELCRTVAQHPAHA